MTHYIEKLNYEENLELSKILDSDFKSEAYEDFLTETVVRKADGTIKMNALDEQVIEKKLKTWEKILEIIMQDPKYNFKFPNNFTTNKHENILIYKDGIYKNGLDDIQNRIKLGFGSTLTESNIRNILNLVCRYNLIDINKFDKDPYLINCKNGLINLKNGDLYDHTYKYKSLMQIPVEYDYNATCPEIDKFLSEIVDPEYIDTMYEIAGYCLINDLPIQTAFMMIASGRNGKGTFIQLLSSLLGHDNITNIPLQKFETDNWAIGYLKNSLANLCGDIPAKKIEDSSTFKQLTGGDQIDAPIKYGSNIRFKNTSKLIFSGNALPRTNDKTYAFYRRWILIKFPNTIEKVDGHILNKLTTPKELSGFLNKAIEGILRLHKNNEFTNTLDPEENQEVYEKEINSFYNWYDKYVYEDINVFTKSIDLYDNYDLYCKNNKITTGNNYGSFAQLLSIKVKNIKNIKKDTENRLNGYIGLKLKTEDDINNYKNSIEIDNNSLNLDFIG